MTARVLIAESDADLVANLMSTFANLGHEVRSADNSRQALELARNWVHVALVDFQMPEGGPQLAGELKAQNPDCEVVLLTTHSSVDLAATAVEEGAWDYLVKPCATPVLLATLSKAVRRVEAQLERRELSRRAQRAERLAAVGTLTAGLSHEIRNPLNAAALQLTVLERRLAKIDASLRAPLLEPLTLARDEIRRLEHILRDFLQFARPAPVTMKPLMVAGLLHNVVDLLKADAERRGIEFGCVVRTSPEAVGDVDQLIQVLINLSLNALDAAPRGGKVRLENASDETAIHIYVDDSGPGISVEQRERLFEPFYTTKAQGSGLGLPVSHAIISQHGGSIAVRKSPLGGARFEVILPYHPI